MYTNRPGLILGFHGCDLSVRNKVVCEEGEFLKPSDNEYDWLGNGVYFWENNYERALEFATFLSKNSPHNTKQKINNPSVVGAIIDLGMCLDLLDSRNLNIVKQSFELFKYFAEEQHLEVPKNLPLKENEDLLKRYLDCAVIELLHRINIDLNKPGFDSVRGVFFEGNDLYPNAGFKEKNHIQIAIRNPNCIKGYFIPREIDKKYNRP